MSVYQPSLWDNIALENGYRCLAALRLDEAVRQFNEALEFPLGDEENIHAALAVCQFWQPRIQQLQVLTMPFDDTISRSGHIAELLEDYSRYPFTPMIRAFKKALLNYFADRINQEADINNMETAFDLLLGVKEYRKAASFVAQFIKRNAEKHSLLYLLAQAQWLYGNKSEALGNYARALLNYPDKLLTSRIEPEYLKKLIDSYGMSMAPAYGWLRDILPLIPLNEVKILNEKHDIAIQS